MKKILQQLAVFAAISTFCISGVSATNYYVDDVNGLNTNPGNSSASAKKTIQAASNLTNPGDTVFIMNGTYLSSPVASQSILTITRSGTAGNYITYKPFAGHTPKLKLLAGLTYQVWRAVAINASYIIFTGIEIEGANQSLDYAGAYQTWQDYENNIKDWNKISMYNCGSIGIGGGADAHHVMVTNCKIHDTGGGIGGSNCDYVTIENNLIYNTCWYSMYAGSGISILVPKSIDAVTSYKIFIRNNVVHNNKTLIPWEQIDALSDGNGIILDVNTGNGSTTPAYVGRYLVANNVSYNNGGGGVHAYKAAHVDIINNTAYNNGTVVGYPEIDANQCSDVKIYNNIMYARSGGNCNGNDANTIYDYNLYNGPSFKNGPHDKNGNPQFVLQATDATANLQLKNTSPAINNGSNVAGQFSATDLLGVARPVGFASDMGAYEYASIIPRPEIQISQGSTEIVSGTATPYDFGDVSSTAPKIVTFTIVNIGDLGLNLTGSPRVALKTGTAFSVVVDAPATVAANGSATFQIKLSPTATPGNYADTISIASNDADENPFTIPLAGYGYDGNKAVQTITFPTLPIKVIGDPNFNPGATSSAGLPVSYTSSNTNVATIVAGQIHIVNSGTSTITALQAGDATTNPARSVSQLLTVTPVLPPPGTNMVSNPTFDVNTNGWSFSNKNGGVSAIASVPMTGSTTNVGMVTVSVLPTPISSDNIQLSTNVFLVKDRNYLISFKANADSARAIGLRILQNASPFSTIFTKTINITTTQATYGTYAYTSSYTGSVALRFFLGNSNKPVYFDDVMMIEEPSALPISLLTFSGTAAGSKAVLNWKTASEINIKEFVIEKSRDGISFTSLGAVVAKNIITGSNYSFTDDHFTEGKTFYRLKSVDVDGTFSYSKTVLLVNGLKVENTLQVFPNPATSLISVSYPVASSKASISIYTTDGKKVGSYSIASGTTQRSIELPETARGVYHIVYRNNNQITTTTFVK